MRVFRPCFSYDKLYCYELEYVLQRKYDDFVMK